MEITSNNKISIEQPKPGDVQYFNLISSIETGVIKVPKFQRDFVWSIDETAKLLDSILKGYPIGTFILWETDERMSEIKNIGNLDLPDTPEGMKVQYVLDGQQRITSLYAAHLCAKIPKKGSKNKLIDYKQIYIDLEKDVDDDDEQIITYEKPEGEYILLSDVLDFISNTVEIKEKYSDENYKKISAYALAFQTYVFSVVMLKKEDMDSAIEVFTRINTGGKVLTLFEIMSAKTYDEHQNFDMHEKWKRFIEKVKDRQYDEVSNSIVLSLISLLRSKTKECNRKTILKLDKQEVIETWDDAVSSLEESIDYFRMSFGVAVSKLLPYDALLVPFAYFFCKNDGKKPDSNQRKYLEEFFWRVSLSYRYSSASESKLAQDISRRIDEIVKGNRPNYDGINVILTEPDDLIYTGFGAGNSYCKAVLCLLASKDPKDFQNNSKVILDNSWLKVANSRNYHHFFPKGCLEKSKTQNANSLMNITFISDDLNKKKIGSRCPSDYIGEFSKENPTIEEALASHFIGIEGVGIQTDDYEVFLKKRAELIFNELRSRIDF